VPEQYASLAREAGLILADSPRASAVLSRRCLQQLLRNEAKAPPGTLFSEIGSPGRFRSTCRPLWPGSRRSAA